MIQRRFVIQRCESSNKILYTTDVGEKIVNFYEEFCPEGTEPVEMYDTEPTFKKLMARNFVKESSVVGEMGKGLASTLITGKDTSQTNKLLRKKMFKQVRTLINDIKGNYVNLEMERYGLLVGDSIVDFPTNSDGTLICIDEDINGAVLGLISMNGKELDLNILDVSRVTDMSQLFADHKKFNGNISNWNTSKVTNMSKMFAKSQFNKDIGQWNVSKVTNMRGMFKSSKFNGNIGNWNTSKVTNMSNIFANSQFTKDISQWDVSKVTNMKQMFKNSKFDGDISQWDVSSVINMDKMFSQSKFNSDISNWDVSRAKKMKDVFKESDFKGDIGNWDTLESEKHQKTQRTVIIVALVIGLIGVGIWF